MTVPQLTPPSRVTVYGIANCDTVRRARHELTTRGSALAFVDWRRAPIEAEVIAHWLDRCGPALINRRARSWASLDEPTRQQLENIGEEPLPEAVITQLRADPTLMRRPLIWYPDGAIGLGWKHGAPAEHFA